MPIKVCTNCSRLLDDEVDTCPGCSGTNFNGVRMTPDWDDVESYLEERNGQDYNNRNQSR